MKSSDPHIHQEVTRILAHLKKYGDSGSLRFMERYGIVPEKAFGVKLPVIRALARDTGKNHALASALWNTGVHEARILAPMLEERSRITKAQLDRWVNALRSWDVCDQLCLNLAAFLPFTTEKIFEYTSSSKEFVKRAGFVMIAVSAVHHKTNRDSYFLQFLPVIEREATDSRNFVKKAVNWALRQIGKKNDKLRGHAILTAGRLLKSGDSTARWIATDALRELKKSK